MSQYAIALFGRKNRVGNRDPENIRHSKMAVLSEKKPLIPKDLQELILKKYNAFKSYNLERYHRGVFSKNPASTYHH